MLAAAIAPSVLLPVFQDRARWKRTGQLYVPNPEVVTVGHEVWFVGGLGTMNLASWQITELQADGHFVLPLDDIPESRRVEPDEIDMEQRARTLARGRNSPMLVFPQRNCA